jgi:hypothetical protein
MAELRVIRVADLTAFASSGYLVTTKRAAAIIGCSDSRVRQMARAGELRQFPVSESGRCVLLDLGEVQRMARHPRHTGRPRNAHH